MSFREDGYRTGYPKQCPAGRLGRTVRAEACGDCPFSVRDKRLYWRCDHPGYQNATGVHFCRACGIELGPYIEAQGWEYCGGDRCRYGESLG